LAVVEAALGEVVQAVEAALEVAARAGATVEGLVVLAEVEGVVKAVGLAREEVVAWAQVEGVVRVGLGEGPAGLGA
jgi:hypothetical protein